MRYDSRQRYFCAESPPLKEHHMTRPVVAFQIRGRDAVKLQNFYKQLFGWQMKTDNPMGVAFIALLTPSRTFSPNGSS